MKTRYDKKNIQIAKTPLDALEDLYIFFQSDMWHAKNEEWKTEEDMQEYLDAHFNICKKQIKKMKK